jgi:hypothetical protein
LPRAGRLQNSSESLRFGSHSERTSIDDGSQIGQSRDAKNVKLANLAKMANMAKAVDTG